MRLATLAICLVALLLTACDCGEDCAPPADDTPASGDAAPELQSDQPVPGEAGGHPTQVGSGGGLGG